MESKTSISDLPCELISNIIDSLDGHVNSLKSCALTCRAWLHRSNTWLHHTMILTTDGPDTVEFMINRYQSTPTRELVRQVKLCTPLRRDLPLDELSTIVLLLSSHFPKVYAFNIHAYRGISHVDVPPLMKMRTHVTLNTVHSQDVSVSFTKFPTITFIPFDCPEHLFRFLLSIPRLSRIISFSDIQFSDAYVWFAEDAPLSKHLLPALRKVSLEGLSRVNDRDQFVSWLCRGRDNSSLSSISLTGPCTAAMNESLAMLGDSLHKLALAHRHNTQHPEVSLQLTPCRSLQTLHIITSHIDWLLLSLQDVNLSALRHVAISCKVCSNADFHPTHWGPLDEYFSTRCPNLLTFTLVLAPYRHYSRRFKDSITRAQDPAVDPAIKVAVRSQMANTIRRTTFRLILARNVEEEYLGVGV